MELLADGRILAAAGNGSDTDGVYLGEVVAIAEPGTMYAFTLKAKCPLPAALALGPKALAQGDIGESGCTAHFYAGTRTGIYHGTICGDVVSWLPTLTYPSGALSSVCSSVQVFSGDTMVYAGGYSGKLLMRLGPLGKSAIVADPEAYLLRGRSELTAVKRSNTTAMAELTTAGEVFLAIATLDSGVQLLSGGRVVSTLPPPVSREPILAMTPIPMRYLIDGDNQNRLAIATPSGIYTRCLPDENCVWSTTGKPPAAVRCLAQQNRAVLWAGTDSGLYRLDYPSGAAVPAAAAPSAVAPYRVLRADDGSVAIDFRQPFSGAVVVYALNGQVLDRVIAVGENSVRVPARRGISLFRMYRGGTIAGAGRIAR
jgi:hypothetical protein